MPGAAISGRALSSYVASDAMQGATHGQIVQLLASGQVSSMGDLRTQAANGDLERVRVIDRADPRRWIQAIVKTSEQGAAFEQLGHDIAVASNLSDATVPMATRGDGSVFMAEHAGLPSDLLVNGRDATGAPRYGARSAVGLRDMAIGRRIAAGASVADARAGATLRAQQMQALIGLTGNGDAHAGNHHLSAAGDAVLIDFGRQDMVNARTGLPHASQPFMAPVAGRARTAADGLPPDARFTPVDDDVVRALADSDRQQIARAVERFRASIEGESIIGLEPRLVSADAVPPEATWRAPHPTDPSKVYVNTGRVRPPAEGLTARILERLDDIVRNRGVRWIATAAK